MEELYIELSGYRLYFDGTIESKDSTKTHELMLLGIHPSQISTKIMTDDIKQHNLLVDDDNEKIKLSKQNEEIEEAFTPLSYNIPTEYLTLDLKEYVMEKLQNIPMTAQELSIAQKRVERELEEISKRKIELLFKTIIYVVDTFNKKSIVYGVGRGSSCACYILYLIGLHLVNPIKYNIPVEEFFH